MSHKRTFFYAQKFKKSARDNFLAKKYKLELSAERIFPFEPAELKKPKNSAWYVQFYVYSDKEQKLKRRKKIVYGTSQKERKDLDRLRQMPAFPLRSSTLAETSE